MKKLISLLFLTTLVTLFLLFAKKAYAKPNQAQGPHEHITGNLTAVVGGVTLWLDFNAHDTIPQKGRVVYANSVGGYFEGEVNCYKRYGTQVVFAGLITGGTYLQPEFKVAIKLDDSKKVRVPVGTSLNCSAESTFPAIVTVDHFVLHEVPENAPLPEPLVLVLGASENATPSEKAIDNKWDLSGDFVAHPGYNWAGLAEGATWNYDFHIKESLDDASSVGSIHFQTGDISVIGHVEDFKNNYAYWAGSNIAAAGTAVYNGMHYYFMFLYSERATWFALSDQPYDLCWDNDTVYGRDECSSRPRLYELHSKVPEETFLMDYKDIH